MKSACRLKKPLTPQRIVPSSKGRSCNAFSRCLVNKPRPGKSDFLLYLMLHEPSPPLLQKKEVLFSAPLADGLVVFSL
jgi:hypothetical protein